MIYRLLLTYSLFFVLLEPVLPQRGYVQIDGVAEYMMDPLEGANVQLFCNDEIIHEMTTEQWGRFRFKLEFNNTYTIKVSKEPFISKILQINTTVPVYTKGVYIAGFAIGLLDPCEGVDYSLLDQPVDKIYFNERKDNFISNKDYVFMIQTDMEDLVWNIQQCLREKYDEIIRQADELFNQQSYQKARQKYMLAQQADPYDRYPDKMIKRINDLLAEKDAVAQAYTDATRTADGLFQEDELKDAAKYYQKALDARPEDSYAKERLEYINSKLEKNENAAKQARENERKYANVIFQAESAYRSKNYEEAKKLYLEALDYLPQESLPKERLNEIEVQISKENISEPVNQQEQLFTANEARAEQFMAEGNYTTALKVYQDNLKLKPGDKETTRKIEAINEILNDEKANQVAIQEQKKKDRLDAMMDQAEAFEKEGDYTQARQQYLEAQKIDPQSEYIRNKINQVNKQINEQQEKLAQAEANTSAYKLAMERADQFYEQGKYNEALAELDKALEIKPNDFVAGNKIASVENALKEKQEEQLQKAEKEEQMQQKIEQADILMEDEKYEEAIALYNEVKNAGYGSFYVQNKITEISNIKAKRASEEAKRIENDRRYAETIKSAARLEEEGDYNKALEEYTRAKLYKPLERFPDQKIAEIKGFLENKKALEEMRRAQQAQYRTLIATADKFMTEGNYTSAKQAYADAKRFGPSESYPDEQLKAIDNILEKQRQEAANKQQLAQQYKEYIQKADELLAQKQYDQARLMYQNASKTNESNSYPKQQIAVIDKILTEAAFEKRKQDELQKNYDATIASADKFYSESNLAAARSEYQKALRLKPNEKYPAQRIKQINEKLALIAQSTKTKEKTTTTKSTGKTIEKLQFKNASEKKKYMEGLRSKYGVGVTKEIYSDKYKTTERYIIIRGDDIEEFRKVSYSWGTEYYHYDIQTTAIYFNQQTKVKSGEKYTEIEL